MFLVDKAKCTGCGTCIQICPQEAISLKGDEAVIDRQLCLECGSCLMACPVEAIRETKQPAALPPVLKNTTGSGSEIENIFITAVNKARTFSNIFTGSVSKRPFGRGNRNIITAARSGRGRCHRRFRQR